MRPRIRVPVRYGNKRTLAPLDVPTAAAARGAAPQHPSRCATPARGRNLDDVIVFLDRGLVPEWLVRANTALKDLQSWWSQDRQNGMRLTHFWLSNFSDEKRRELLHMEYDLLLQEVKMALDSGVEKGAVTDTHINWVMRAVLPEYPNHFGDDDGTGFLDLARILAIGNGKPEFRELLAAVKCSTENTLYAQWLLALRSLSLVTMVTAPIVFFRRLEDLTSTQGTKLTSMSAPAAAAAQGSIRPSTASTHGRRSRPPSRASSQASTPMNTASIDAVCEEAFTAARTGHADVLYYLLTRNTVGLDAVDSGGRTLLAVAVGHGQRDVVRLLLDNADHFDVNTRVPASGNTALHVAVCGGDMDLVQMLLSAGADADVANTATGSTPRLLADMLGHEDIVKLFENHKA